MGSHRNVRRETRMHRVPVRNENTFREDVKRKIMLFARGRHLTVILSCIGTVSAVNLKLSSSSETVTYEGLFDILNLSGTYSDVGARHDLVGSLNLTLVGPDGRVRGGLVEDVMVAAIPVQRDDRLQVIVATLSPRAPKPKNNALERPETSTDRTDGGSDALVTV
ncbi:hypothetical protein OROMI_017548 [Orobanche minor]